MRRMCVVLLIFGVWVVSGTAFADSISDVYFVSGRVTLSRESASATVEEGAEPFIFDVAIHRNPMTIAVMLLDKNNQFSDVIFTQMKNGVETLTFCSQPLTAGCNVPKGYTVFPIAETGKTQQIGTYFGAAADDITIRSEVPEPSSLLLMGTALAGLVPVIRRKLRM
jgi:hypothetical protein